MKGATIVAVRIVSVLAIVGVAGYLLGFFGRFDKTPPVHTEPRNTEGVADATVALTELRGEQILVPRSAADISHVARISTASPSTDIKLAQNTYAALPSPPPAPSDSPSVAPGPTKPAVDETALRYFARQGDTRRLATEISRLRSLYPDWVPPDDPTKAPPVTDVKLDHMWQLYSQGQFAAVRAEITARQIAEPGWTPPKDLLDRLNVAETRERLVNASDAKQYGTVMSLAVSTPSLLTCGDIDVLWRLAASFAETDRKSRAVDVFHYILTTCTDTHDRLSTMQKAVAFLPRSDLEPLLALGHAGADGDEFHAIREDLARNAVAAGDSDPKTTASPTDIKLLEDAATANQSAGDALTLGGYLLQHGDPVGAEHWYRVSYDRHNAAQPAEGVALALLALKRPAEAEAILAPWSDTNENTRKSYLATVASLLAIKPTPILQPDILTRIIPMVAAERDSAVAQQLGWYAHALRQDDTAARWFATAQSWTPGDEPSAFGLAIASLTLQRRDTLAAVVKQWGGRSLRIRALVDPAAARKLQHDGTSSEEAITIMPTALAPSEPEPVSPAASSAPAARAAAPVASNANAPAFAQRSAQVRRPVRERDASPPRGQCGTNLAGGWCLMNLNRDARAAEVFRQIVATGSPKDRQEAAYGLSLAYLRMGLTSEAVFASAQAQQSPSRVRELSVAILTQRINADYQAARYAQALIGLDQRARLAPEQTDLLMLRGWCYYHLNRFDEAEQTFQALAATGVSGADAALSTIRQALNHRQ